MVRRQGEAEDAIVYNGEIYNADELKEDLCCRGYRFETTCDTEVILCGYMEYGMEVARKLNGIFAFAVWDKQRDTLFLCRDRLGVKPLFYALEGSTLVFGSEPKALFAHPDMTPRADLDSFRELFGVGPARTPGCGVFRGLREVKPGCIVACSQAGVSESPYWSLEARPHTDNYEETVERVSWLLRDACKDLLPPELLYRKKSPYPKTYSPAYVALLVERFQRLLEDPHAPIHRFLDRKKAQQFLSQPKDYGKPWFGQLMAGPQMLAYFLQINHWMEFYRVG